MKTYCITFQLNNNFKTYTGLAEAIKSTGTWWNLYQGVWFVQSDKTSAHIRDYLFQFMSNGDRIFVIEVTGNWAAIGHTQNEYDWLHKTVG